MWWSPLLDLAPSATGSAIAAVVLLRGPRPRFGPWTALRRLVERYGTFGGRASRSEHWWPVLVLLVLDTALQVAALPLGHAPAQAVHLLRALVAAAVLLPDLAVTVRRLHDTGRSAWWALWALTLVGIPWVLWWTTRPSQAGPTRGARRRGRPCGCPRWRGARDRGRPAGRRGSECCGAR